MTTTAQHNLQSLIIKWVHGRRTVCSSQDRERRNPHPVEYVKDADDGSVIAWAGGEHVRAGTYDALDRLLHSREKKAKSL